MPNRLWSLTLSLGILVPLSARPAAGEPKEKSGSRPSPLERVGYHPAPGAQILGDPVERPGGDEVAFFEQSGAAFALVVCVPRVGPARWTVTEATTRLHIYWSGPTEIVLGPDALAPRMVVRWQVRRATSWPAAAPSRHPWLAVLSPRRPA
jgi:hypothetical protein